MKKSSAKPSEAEGTSPEAPRGAGALAKYRDKRDPLRTNEPFAAERKVSARETRVGRFVVHLHAARRTHYDLRLQIGGTLKSFAVPRGPSLDPKEKRLAVLTEDHPLEYLDFEEVIPEGNYGAGAMIVWDVGKVRYLETHAEEGLARGKLDFELAGFKLKGRFALAETGSRRAPRDAKPEWLLFKKTDAFSSAEGDILGREPHSVLSGLEIDELARKDEITAELEARAAELGAVREPFSALDLEPMLCALSGAELSDDSRCYELKLDGVRIVADKIGGGVALRYRNQRPASASYPEIARAVRALAPERLVLDGEIVAFDETGRPSFERLAPRIHSRRALDVERVRDQIPVVYVVFDVLAIGDLSLVNLPLVKRKQLLLECVRGRGRVIALDHIVGDGSPLFELCRERRLEGVVAKRLDSPYRPGPRRTEDWVKIKCEREDDFVVLGWIAGRGGRERLGALLLGSHSKEGLVFRGRVGSGLDERTIRALRERLDELVTDTCPALDPVPPDVPEARFVRPELVVNVRYLGWTEEGRLRAPVFRGLREDVESSECTAAPPVDYLDADAPLPDEAPLTDDVPLDAVPPGAVPPDAVPPHAGRPEPSRLFTITNVDKVFWPEDGLTKGDLIEYYTAVSSAMLPFLRERPLVLVRYPDGIHGKNFYQWNVPVGTPKWLRTLALRSEEEEDEKGGPKNVFLVDGVEALRYLANLGCIPIHVLASRECSREECDFLTVDFDIGEQPFHRAVELALSLKELLEQIGLSGYPKTSGQRGLHVLIPLGQGVSFDTAKLLVELIGRVLTARHRDIATMERRVSKRGPRVYVDTGQTGRSRTIVAPYSVRATVGATVSTPLLWDEVHRGLDPARFTMLSLPGRLAELGDPAEGLLREQPDVAAAVNQLGGLLN